MTDAMNEKQLLPCPFCGHEVATISDGGRGLVFTVHCGKCRAAGPWEQCAADAQSTWNTRIAAIHDQDGLREDDDCCPPHCCCCDSYEPCCDCGQIIPSKACIGEKCWCGAPAAKKVDEEILFDDPNPARHNLTRYICPRHYAQLMGPLGAEQVGIDRALAGEKP